MQLVDTHLSTAIGLILGYGAISMHGSEGYRAERARVACIFSDAPEPLAPEHAPLRTAVAAEYGVPCITLEEAISTGFLNEMGVRPHAIEQLKGWIAAGRPIALHGHELKISRLLAKGLTNKEIARSIGLNSRAVDFHVYRLIKKTGSKNRTDLANWVTTYAK